MIYWNVFCALTCCCWHPAPSTQLNQIPQTLWAGRRRGIEQENILMGCAFLGGDNFLSSLAVEIVCLALWQFLSPAHTMTRFGEKWGGRGGGQVGGGNTRVLKEAPRRGVTFCEIVDLVDCISSPPWQPPMWLSCSVKNSALKASSRRRVQRPAQRARFVWDLSLTTRAAPHLILMDPTYAVITMPTSCQLWCSRAFVLQRDATVLGWSVSICNKSAPQRSHQNKCFPSSLRSFDLEGEKHPLTPYCKDWIHCKRTPASQSNKGLFIGARLAAYEIRWQLLTSWLQRIKQAKRNTQDQQAFCSAELALSGVEVNNPGDKHLLSIRY